MNETNSKTEFLKISFGVIVMIGFFSIAIVAFLDQIDLQTNPKYTIGKTLFIWKDAKGNKSVKYEYTVKEKKYCGSTSISEYNNLLVPGGRYFVVFSSENHNNSEMLIDYKVPISINESPLEGWSTLPKQNE